jgi:PhzF family phenazine biosynthesis protein
MARHRYLQLDVFADRPGAGNPLGIVFEAQTLSTQAMQSLAAWLNLSETVFFLPPDEAGADYNIRIFTPGSELPFAGHPSVGAAWAALDAGLVMPRDGRFVQQCAAGLLPVRAQGSGATRDIVLRSPRGRRLAGAPDGVPPALAALARPGTALELWDNGPRWWLLEAAAAAAVRDLRPDFTAIAAWTNATASTGIAVFAVEPAADHDVVVRAFCPGDAVNVPEDPVTGSANALVAACLAQRGRLPGRDGRYVASQGREVGRDGRVQLHVDPAGDVWIGGHVQPVIDGMLAWPSQD